LQIKNLSKLENGEDGLQIKHLSNWKIQSVENGEDGLQIKHLSNWKISKYGKW
jgi:hypothetical protein